MDNDNFVAQNSGAKEEKTVQVDSSSISAASTKNDLLAMIVASVAILFLVGGSFLLATLTKKSSSMSGGTSDNSYTPGYGNYEDDEEDDGGDDDLDDYVDEDDDEDDDEARNDDIERLMMALEDYRTNNLGSTPLVKDNGLKTFVRRYIDADCSEGDNSDDEDVYTYGDTCGESFRDPDGTEYSIRITELPETVTVGDESWKVPGLTRKTHEIVMIGMAKCDGDIDGYVKKATGISTTAVLYRGDDLIICADNS